MMKRRVTLRDIAELANVHFTTVGLALRDSPRISEETRLKIKRIALEIGYTPDPILSALNSYKQTKRRPHFQSSIAWINNWPQREMLVGNSEFFEYYQGAQERAKELGYSITEFWLQDKGVRLSSLPRVLKARNIQCIIFAPQPVSDSRIDLDISNLAAVSLGYSLVSPCLNVVTNHHFRSIISLLQNLSKAGFRKIGLAISKDWNGKVGLSWLGGLLSACESMTPEIEPIFLEHRRGQPELIVEQYLKHNIEVIVSHNEMYHELLSIGVKIPDDISFANLGVDFKNKDVSGIYQNSKITGRKSVDVVVDMLHRGEFGVSEHPMHILIESSWNPGKTLIGPQKVDVS